MNPEHYNDNDNQSVKLVTLFKPGIFTLALTFLR